MTCTHGGFDADCGCATANRGPPVQRDAQRFGSEVLSKSGIDPVRTRSLLQLMLRDGRLVKIAADLIYHREAITNLRQVLSSRKGQHFNVADFKDWTGVSRKYAIPLLEFLDRERLTRRDGDRRLIL